VYQALTLYIYGYMEEIRTQPQAQPLAAEDDISKR
jgi:hypothetical protein